MSRGIRTYAYGAGRQTLRRGEIGTRYAMVVIRIFVGPASPEDLRQVHRLRDAIEVEQPARGRFEVPTWDPVSVKRVRDALLQLGRTLADTRGAFGAKDHVDPVRHLIGTAGVAISKPTPST